MLWWQWLIIGIALLVADIALVNIYYLTWFGLGALLVGGALFLFPDMSIAEQIGIFALVSLAFLLFWIVALRPLNEKRQRAAAAAELSGVSAVVVRFNNGRGVLRLQKPIGGRDCWDFISDAALDAGQRVVVSALNADGTVQAAPSARDS